MCGIIGILGKNQVAPILIDALRRLEYRGYDSAGIATINNGVLDRRRAVGKLVNLADLLVHDPIAGTSGIGHTRWATHGAPNLTNAHPHQADQIAVVHNGIIENFKELRDELSKDGYTFDTDTDTETIVKLCQQYMDAGETPKDAVSKTIARLKGAYALCFLFQGENDLMIAARQGSPLAIGHGNGEMFIGSDAIALAPMTNKITYLEEGDWAIITRSTLEIRDINGALANRSIREMDFKTTNIGKGLHKHFMSKEIAEQPTVLSDTLKYYINQNRTQVTLPNVDFSKIEHISMIACGTAYLACYVAKYWFEQIAGITVDLDVASEFRYREPPLRKNTLAIFVSQSGETADTLAALHYCNKQNIQTIGVINAPESSIAREADSFLEIHAGVEIGVASTKAFTCQLLVLLTMVIHAARQKGKLDQEQENTLVTAMISLPNLFNQAMQTSKKIINISRDLSQYDHALFLGRGSLFPIALEGALKLKEISYIHAEGYASGELKHGPIALVDENMPIIVMAPKDALFDKTVSNMQEVMARNGKVILITDKQGAKIASQGVWHTIIMPSVHPILAPILYALPAQLLAYHTAVAKGTDVDQPRNLAKSVTVE